MKKILSVLLLAAMVLTVASCNEATTTTAAGTTAGTTTAGGPVVTPAPIITTEPNPEMQAEDPYLYNNPNADRDLGTLLEGLTNHNEAGKVDTTYTPDGEDRINTSLLTIGFNTWNTEKENIPQMFDGVRTQEEWGAAGQGKIGGGTSENACYLFNMTEKVSVKAYVIWSGNDNATYTDRNPVAWHLYATNDVDAMKAMREEGADYTTLQESGKWTDLDYVWDGSMAAVNFEANGYDVDADKEGEYQYFCWMIEYTGGGSFQINELEIFG